MEGNIGPPGSTGARVGVIFIDLFLFRDHIQLTLKPLRQIHLFCSTPSVMQGFQGVPGHPGPVGDRGPPGSVGPRVKPEGQFKGNLNVPPAVFLC